MFTEADAAGSRRPEYVKTVMDQGLALFKKGQLDSAELLYATIAEEPSVKPLVQHMRGVIAIHLGEDDRAQQLIEEALRLNPTDGEAHANLGLLLLKGRQYPTALAAYAAALTLRPDSTASHHGLAKALAALGLADLAFDAFQDVLVHDPDYISAIVDLSALLTDMDRRDEAVTMLQEALSRHRGQADIEAALAAATFVPTGGGHAHQIAGLRNALTRHPDRADLHGLLATCLLASGDWPAAWEEYEWRLKAPHIARSMLTTTQPRWKGEDISGRTIVLQSEQGHGDVLQFVRYAALVKARGARVIVRAQEALLPVLRRATGVDAVFGPGEKPPAFDVHIPLLSLPLLFGTRVDTVPSPVPYVTPDPARVGRWRSRFRKHFRGHTGLTIGLVWQGNPGHPDDRHRSMRLSTLGSLLECPGARFVSLQVGAGQEQVTAFADRITDLGAEINPASFADAAAIIAQLDLVITVDSAVAHLAGALGKPVWILLAARHDWRWLEGRDDTPWYPQARLFRQRTPGDWDAVVEQVRGELWSLAGAGTPPAAPSTDRLRAALPPRAVDPVVCDALFVDGVRHHGGKHFSRARKLFERVLVLDPNHANTLCNLGALETGVGNPARAVTLLERAVALTPDLAPAHQALADALQALQRPSEAAAHYQRARELAPDGETADAPQAAAAQGSAVAAHFGKAEKTIRERYSKALQANPGNAAVHAQYAIALYELGDLDGAMTHFHKAVRIDQRQSGEFYEALGRTCVARGNHEGGEISLKHALAIEPRLVGAHCALGDLYVSLGRTADAAASFHHALEIDPACPAARRAIARETA